MTKPEWLAVAALLLMAAWFAWEIVCLNRTQRQRSRMIDSWPTGSRRFDIMRAAYHRVSFDQHFRALTLFRDPFELYPADAFPIGDERRRGK